MPVVDELKRWEYLMVASTLERAKQEADRLGLPPGRNLASTANSVVGFSKEIIIFIADEMKSEVMESLKPYDHIYVEAEAAIKMLAIPALHLPKTKLWDTPQGPIIVLECTCGIALDYPGHPDERTETTCAACGRVWRLA